MRFASAEIYYIPVIPFKEPTHPEVEEAEVAGVWGREVVRRQWSSLAARTDHSFLCSRMEYCTFKSIVLYLFHVNFMWIYCNFLECVGSCLVYVCVCSSKHSAWNRVGVSKYSLRE